MTYYHLNERLQKGWELRVIDLGDPAVLSLLGADFHEKLIPLFVIRHDELVIVTVTEPYEFHPGDSVIAMVESGLIEDKTDRA